jgi:hypothetical protein
MKRIFIFLLLAKLVAAQTTLTGPLTATGPARIVSATTGPVVVCSGSASGNAVNSAAQNCTGATAFFLTQAFTFSGTCAITDNGGNSWNTLTKVSVGSGTANQLGYVFSVSSTNIAAYQVKSSCASLPGLNYIGVSGTFAGVIDVSSQYGIVVATSAIPIGTIGTAGHYANGGTGLSGTGTCTVTYVDSSGSPITAATATVPITAGVIAGSAPLTLVTPGTGYSGAVPSSGTLSNGTGGVCGGTANLGAVAYATTLTPNFANEVCWVGVGWASTSTAPSATAGFSTFIFQPQVGGTSFATGLTYLLSPASGVGLGPTISWTTSSNGGTSFACAH